MPPTQRMQWLSRYPHWLSAGLLGLACLTPARAQPPPPTALPAAATAPRLPQPLPGNEAETLRHWYDVVGPRRPTEEFGDLLVRVASVQLGKPYFDAPWSGGEEVLRCEVNSFNCVSLVEGGLALGRCVWRGTPNTPCFLEQLQNLRYRDGRIDGYPSRLHYYEEWLLDNTRRGHLQTITAALGAVATPVAFFFMTAHPTKYPALADPQVRAQIAATEARLSTLPIAVLPRAQVRRAQAQLHNGDVIAIAGAHDGIIISHTGFISRDERGVVHLLHASSLRKKVVLTDRDLADYMMHGADRRGILVARPLPP